MDFDTILETIKGIHSKKSHDYSARTDKFSNFEFASELSKHLSHPTSKVFATMVGIKLSRLINLQDKDPKNESVEDTWIDICTYMILWTEYELSRKKECKILTPVEKMDEIGEQFQKVINALHRSTDTIQADVKYDPDTDPKLFRK